MHLDHEPLAGAHAEWVTVATILRTRGIRGELFASGHSSDPERYSSLASVVVFPKDGRPSSGGHRLEIEYARWIHKRLVLKFRGIDSINEAQPLVGGAVCIPESQRRPLAQGEFYISDLVGCEVVEKESGRPLGRVRFVQESAGASVLEVAPGGEGSNEILIPFNQTICVAVDVAGRRIEVDLPDGLLELNRP